MLKACSLCKFNWLMTTLQVFHTNSLTEQTDMLNIQRCRILQLMPQAMCSIGTNSIFTHSSSYFRAPDIAYLQ